MTKIPFDEEFKQLYDTDYLISNHGRFIKEDGYIMSQSIASSGYMRCSMTVNGKGLKVYTHRAVADHFVEKPESPFKLVPDHIDDDRLRNHHTNLQWITQSENVLKASKNRTKLPDKTVKLIKKWFNNGDSYKTVHKKMVKKGINVSLCSLYRIRTGKTYKGVS